MIGYGTSTTTERVLVNIEGLINLSLLKIQSSPLGKLRGISEMNLHVPQSYSSAVELEELAAVPYQIVSPATNGALVQLVQDSLLGYYVITHDDILIDRRDMMNILMGVPSFNGVLPEPAVDEDKRQYWTGKQLVSIGMPRINMKFKGVVIENGELIKGRIGKGESNMIIQIIYNDYGPKVCQEYLDNIQNIVTRFLVKHGFSIGVSDLIISDDVRRKIQDIIVDGKKQVLELEKKIHLNILTDIKKTVHETFEGKVMQIMTQTTKKIEDMYKKQLKDDNRAVMMKDAGSKGKDLNIRQMSTHLGQQVVQGKRVPIGYTDRTLPHYYRYDSDVISRGFVENSFMDGLTPQESFFHAMGGREGLIDTAVKTSESGYIQRKLIKAMEDLKVYHDNTVRNANGDIVQFLYGFDGIDASGGIEGNKMELVTDEYAVLKENLQFKEGENWETFMSKSAIKKMKQNKDWKKRLETYFRDLMDDRDKLFEIFDYTANSNMEFLKAPFNPERIINNTIQIYKIRGNGLSDLSPLEVIDAVDDLCDHLTINEFPNFNFNLIIKTKFAPKAIIKKYRLTKLAFAHAINLVKMKFNDAIVQAGEMVGMLSAQSLGETSTQLTLNTFHQAGAGATVTTQGVPRLRELLSNTKNMATPSSTLFLNEDARYTLEKALEVKYNIEITTIRDIVISCSIYNDPDNKFKSVVEEDRNILEIYKVFHEIDDNCREMKANPWVLRFKFDRSKMMERKISMDNIYQIITQSYSNAICIYSDDNSNDLVFRIRLDFIASTEKADDDVKLLKKVENKILDLVVKGVDGIDGSHVSEHNINLVKDEVGNYITKSERKLTTDGSNLIELINANNVDFSRCYCNDINEVYNLYGIEAARTILFNEFNNIFGSSGVNYRHIAMLCDIMTNQGIIMSIDRHGINRGTNGPLAKCSFEEAVDQLQKAAIHGDRDNVAGVSANIMMGQVPPSGTGDSTLILDELKLIETQEIEKPEDEVDIDEILNVSNYCQENVAINFNINKVKKKKINVKNIPKVKAQ